MDEERPGVGSHRGYWLCPRHDCLFRGWHDEPHSGHPGDPEVPECPWCHSPGVFVQVQPPGPVDWAGRTLFHLTLAADPACAAPLRKRLVRAVGHLEALQGLLVTRVVEERLPAAPAAGGRAAPPADASATPVKPQKLPGWLRTMWLNHVKRPRGAVAYRRDTSGWSVANEIGEYLDRAARDEGRTGSLDHWGQTTVGGRACLVNEPYESVASAEAYLAPLARLLGCRLASSAASAHGCGTVRVLLFPPAPARAARKPRRPLLLLSCGHLQKRDAPCRLCHGDCQRKGGRT